MGIGIIRRRAAMALGILSAGLLPVWPLAAPPAVASEADMLIDPAGLGLGVPDPVLAGASVDERSQALRCLTQAIYYEAANEPEDGQRAVAQVVVNRLRDPRWPDTICGVVYQGALRRGGGCQFTFTCDGSLRRRPEARRWAIARLIAAEALAGQTFRPVADSTHYHASYVSPRWAPRLVRTAAIGLHRFYRSPGIGEAPTARYAEFGGGSTTSSGAYVAAAGRPVRFAATTVPGVTVHRGGAGAGPVRGPAPAQAGVRVHRGALPTIPGPQPLPQPAPGFDLAAVSR